jgi:hypothetical protein
VRWGRFASAACTPPDARHASRAGRRKTTY